MVAGQMVAGLENIDHQTKILAEAATLTTLQKTFNRLVSLEMTDQSTPSIQQLHALHHNGQCAEVRRQEAVLGS